MKRNNGALAGVRAFAARFAPRDKWLFAIFAASLAAAILALIFLGPASVALQRNFQGVAAGKIADRDVTAGKDVVYVDEEATRLRIAMEEKLVLPIFQLDSGVTARLLQNMRNFKKDFQELVDQKAAADTAATMLEGKYPGSVSRPDIISLLENPLKSQAFVYAEEILDTLLLDGVFALPATGLEPYNGDYFELRRTINNKTETEQRPRGSMITKNSLPQAIAREIAKKNLASPLSGAVADLVVAFGGENAFFEEGLSRARIAGVRGKVEPVTRMVGKYEILVKKGELVTEEANARITAIRKALSRANFGLSLGGIGILLAAAAAGYFVLRRAGSTPLGRNISVIMILASLVYYITVLLACRASPGQAALDGAYFMPTALFSGVAAALAGHGLGMLYTIVLSLLAASASNLNPYYMLAVILSGLAASLMTAAAKTRLKLVQAAFLQGIAQFVLACVLLSHYNARFQTIMAVASLEGLNGFISIVLMLALLPVLEQTFNIPTRFRLMELSDLNAEPLKQLLMKAPGTYSHSINVANLAEAAAEDIKANPLLARVGAYYHDIGKIDQPEYFVENQRGMNKHDDINPRLSATVIRSHVKLGIEKGRELRLPQPVVDIIAQHHGNSLIALFYEKAKGMEESIRKEDFSYPGSPPSSKEAGIVMLADTVEAATRTLKKPSVPRLEAFIRQMIFDKIEDGQLDQCSLTLKDLETIRHSFSRILAGQYHARLEYPKQKEQGK